ncbi:hypothetical protein COOONC_24823 [Cooperia oncophora]
MLTNDAQSRIDDHLSGKLHIAYTRIKDQIDLMVKAREEKKLQLEKERTKDKDDNSRRSRSRDRDGRDRRSDDRRGSDRRDRRDRSRSRDRRECNEFAGPMARIAQSTLHTSSNLNECTKMRNWQQMPTRTQHAEMRKLDNVRKLQNATDVFMLFIPFRYFNLISLFVKGHWTEHPHTAEKSSIWYLHLFLF